MDPFWGVASFFHKISASPGVSSRKSMQEGDSELPKSHPPRFSQRAHVPKQCIPGPVGIPGQKPPVHIEKWTLRVRAICPLAL